MKRVLIGICIAAAALVGVAGGTCTDDVMVEKSIFTGATVITIPSGRSYELNVK